MLEHQYFAVIALVGQYSTLVYFVNTRCQMFNHVVEVFATFRFWGHSLFKFSSASVVESYVGDENE
jgi:hypothetical protein